MFKLKYLGHTYKCVVNELFRYLDCLNIVYQYAKECGTAHMFPLYLSHSSTLHHRKSCRFNVEIMSYVPWVYATSGNLSLFPSIWQSILSCDISDNRCPPLIDVRDGGISSRLAVEGSVIQVVCDPGHILPDGSNTYLMGCHDGSWNTSHPPTCTSQWHHYHQLQV